MTLHPSYVYSREGEREKNENNEGDVQKREEKKRCYRNGRCISGQGGWYQTTDTAPTHIPEHVAGFAESFRREWTFSDARAVRLHGAVDVGNLTHDEQKKNTKQLVFYKRYDVYDCQKKTSVEVAEKKKKRKTSTPMEVGGKEKHVRTKPILFALCLLVVVWFQ